MNIDRYMVNLFFEIKRNLPFELRSSLKISNPDLGEDMIKLYLAIDNDANQRLIEVFLDRAGESWGKRLYAAKAPAKTIQIHSTSKHLNSGKKSRYYRGVLVE